MVMIFRFFQGNWHQKLVLVLTRVCFQKFCLIEETRWLQSRPSWSIRLIDIAVVLITTTTACMPNTSLIVADHNARGRIGPGLLEVQRLHALMKQPRHLVVVHLQSLLLFACLSPATASFLFG